MELRIVLGDGHFMYNDVIAGKIVKELDCFGHNLAAEEQRKKWNHCDPTK